jgi:iron complex transport system substrate-binding protein
VLKRATLLLAAALAAAALSASPAPAAAGFPVTIHAANGDVRIDSRPVRIVSLSPTATEDLFAVGAGAQVVAVDDQSSYPAAAPRTKLSGFTPNAEAIVGYHPDLVVVSNDGGIVGALQKLGVTVVLEPAAVNLAQAYDEIRQLGSATGHAVSAATVVRSMETRITKLIRSVPKSRRHLRVFHELSPDYYSATSQTFIGRVYKLFGFTNIADAADASQTHYPQLSAEYILSANPQVVVLADSVCCGQKASTAAVRPGWAQLAAVKQHRVIAVDDSVASRWGPRLIAFARAVAAVARKSG